MKRRKDSITGLINGQIRKTVCFRAGSNPATVSKAKAKNQKEKEMGTMMMTDIEIVQAFREAKDRKKQIDILAELNDCMKKEIKEALIRGGMPESEIPEIRGGAQKRKPAEAPGANKEDEKIVNKEEEKMVNEEDRKISKLDAIVNTAVVDAIEGMMIKEWATASSVTEMDLRFHLGYISGIIYMGTIMKEGNRK